MKLLQAIALALLINAEWDLTQRKTFLREPIKLLNDSIGQGERYIHPKYSEEFYIKLAKRLEAGNYTLNIDGYTTNFSIK